MSSAEALWSPIEALIRSRDVNALTLAIDDLDAAQRQALVTPLRRFDRGRFDSPGRYHLDHLVSIVGAGVLPDAKTTATWLSRHGLSYEDGSRPRYDSRVDIVAHLHFVLQRRNVEWLPDLVTELAQRMPKDPRDYWSSERFTFLSRLLQLTGQPPPLDTGVVVAWVMQLNTTQDVIDAFEADPRYRALLIRVFDVDEAGAQIGYREHWPTTMTQLVSQGLVSRDEMLDACIARLGRAGKPGATANYLAVLAALTPEQGEILARSAGFGAMLAASLSTVANVAQQALLAVDRAEMLPLDTFVSSTATALGRREKKVVRAQLAHLAKTRRERATALAPVVVAALPQLGADLARQAVKILGTWRSALSAEQRGELFADAGPLAADIADELRAALGVGQDLPASLGAPAPAVAASALSTETAEPVQTSHLTPIATLSELATEALKLFDYDEQQDPARLERVLEAVMRWCISHRSALRDALTPVLKSDAMRQSTTVYEYGDNDMLAHGVAAVLVAAAGAPAHARRTGRWRDGPARDLDHVLIDRLWTLAAALREPSAGWPVSLPTHANGTLAGTDLLRRLGGAAAAGVEPWTVELEQALLRLRIPDDPDERTSVADAFDALGTSAGKTAATWLSLSLPVEPKLTLVVAPRSHLDFEGRVNREWEDVLVRVDPGGPVEPGSLIWRGLTGHGSGSTEAVSAGLAARYHAAWMAPRHRDLVAAHFLPMLAYQRDASDWGTGDPLLDLAEMDGAFGQASALAVSYGLAGARPETRSRAAAAVIRLSARRMLDARVLGGVLGDLLGRRTVVAKRVVMALRECADSPNGSACWEILAAMLPQLLRASTPVTGMADLLALTVEVAEETQARGRIDGLDDFAARPGRSRQVVEAKRLHRLITA